MTAPLKKHLVVYVAAVAVACLIFSSLYLVFSLTISLTLTYVLICAIVSVLVFAGEYGTILFATLALFLLSQPFIANFFYPELKTLQPQLSATAAPDPNMLSGLDREITITTDRYGFRVNSPDAYERQFKIFMVGGSTTEQILLDDKKTSSALLERYIANPAYSVINTGLSGIRTLHHIATIQAVRKFRPHVIVILLGVNDWNCALRDTCDHPPALRFDPRVWPLTSIGESLWNWRQPTHRPTAPAQLFPNEYYSNVMGQYASKPKIEIDDNAIARYLLPFSRDLAELRQTCEGLRATCVIATQPNGYKPENFSDPEYVRSLWITPANMDWALTENSLIRVAAAFNAHTRSNSKCGNCLLFDLEKLMNGERRYFYDDVHFNNDGANFFAKELLSFLRRHRLVP